MQISRSIFDVEVATRKLFSRFRRPLEVSRPEWPVISATRPLFYFIRLFGLAPFGVSRDRFILGSVNVIYSLFCILVHTYFAYHVLNRLVWIRRGKPILDITETAKVVFNYFVLLWNIFMAISTRKEFTEVLNVVKHFDSRISDLGHPRKEKAAKIWAWGICIFTTFLWITISRISIAAFMEPWSNNVTYLLNYMATSMSTIKFSSVVFLLGQRFRHLNEVAERSNVSTSSREMYMAIDLKVIQRLHNSLMNAGESLSSQYEWPILLWLLNLFVHSVSNVYFLIEWLMLTPAKWVAFQPAFIVCISSWLVAFIGQLLLLHISCHFASTEANIIGSIFINWKSLAVCRRHRAESSLYLINRRLNFSAAGCFNVNLPHLGTIAALLTTYVILLLQFKT